MLVLLPDKITFMEPKMVQYLTLPVNKEKKEEI
jgi:hypothetical protein